MIAIIHSPKNSERNFFIIIFFHFLLVKISMEFFFGCSSNGTLELEPMNSYNRLLMHRLADIFGYVCYDNIKVRQKAILCID